MRIRVRHDIRYQYDTPAKRLIRVLRLTPRNHTGQYVANWRIEVSADCKVERGEDAFGNLTHTFALAGEIEALSVVVDGEVETDYRDGFVRDAVERFPLALFLRDSELTQPDPVLAAFARDAAAASPNDTLTFLHRLLTSLNDAITIDPKIDREASAADAFAAGKTSTAGLTHTFLGCARHLHIPARYVSGYLCRDADQPLAQTIHSWAEAHVPGLGWIGFDPANRLCVTDAYVRVAIGLDERGACPVRGATTGGDGERRDSALKVEQASAQTQT